MLFFSACYRSNLFTKGNIASNESFKNNRYKAITPIENVHYLSGSNDKNILNIAKESKEYYDYQMNAKSQYSDYVTGEISKSMNKNRVFVDDKPIDVEPEKLDDYPQIELSDFEKNYTFTSRFTRNKVLIPYKNAYFTQKMINKKITPNKFYIDQNKPKKAEIYTHIQYKDISQSSTEYSQEELYLLSNPNDVYDEYNQ